MNLADIRFLFAYDRWATRRVLNAAGSVSPETWSGPNAIGERGLGGILVHALGAHQRWRVGWQGLSDRSRPELEPLPTPGELLARWEVEWDSLEAYLDGLDESAVGGPFDDYRLWQTMVHVVNHGTQHRSEAAALLMMAGRSTGDLDLIDFVGEQSTD
jgi:uncharacterized damage-inducible protein DinB